MDNTELCTSLFRWNILISIKVYPTTYMYIPKFIKYLFMFLSKSFNDNFQVGIKGSHFHYYKYLPVV